MTTFYLIRHGANDFLGRALAGRLPNVHLNEQGRAEAQRLVENVVRDHFDYLEQPAIAEKAASFLLDDNTRSYSGEDYENAQVRLIVGECKTRSSHAIREQVPGRVWGYRGKNIRVKDRKHQLNVYGYILTQEDAWIYDFKKQAHG